MKLKYRKTKGITLIECIAYLSIAILLIGIEISIIVSMSTNYYNTLSGNNRINGVDNAFSSINKMIKEEGVSKITRNGEKVRIIKEYYGGNESIKEINLNNKALVVDYIEQIGGSENKTSRNTIIKEIDAFRITEKEKLIYIEIECKGESYIQCL